MANGLDLCRGFHREVVAGIVAVTDPHLPYAAALIGAGSEVLGFDDEVSRDHDFAPRVQLFLPDDVAGDRRERVVAALDRDLPDQFAGIPVRIMASDPGAGADGRSDGSTPTAHHRVEVTTVRAWGESWFGRNPAGTWTVEDWLATPAQRLAGFAAGEVFHDGVGELTAARQNLRWYPDDVWRYLLACGWQRVAQLEPFTGRVGHVGDDRGSRLVAATLVRDLMALAFLAELRFAPYPKWFGSAFARLGLAAEVAPMLDAALTASDWRDREAAIASAAARLTVATNALGLAAPVEALPRAFYDRPYTVVGAGNIRQSLDDAITDPAVRAVIARAGWVGGIDHVSDNVDLLTRPDRIRAINGVWSSEGDPDPAHMPSV